MYFDRKKLIDFFENKKIQSEIDIWNSFDTAKQCLTLNYNYNIIFIEIKSQEEFTSELGMNIRHILNDKCMNIIYFTNVDKFDVRMFETHPYYILNIKKGCDNLTTILDELLIYDRDSTCNYKYISNNSINKLMFNDILYFESDKKYINIYVKNEHTHRFISSLKKEKERLPDNFILVSQSYIVNSYYIKKLSLENITMVDGKEIKVGRNFKDEIRKIIKYVKENM